MDEEILRWINRNLKEFDPIKQDGSFSFESIKPLGDLCLILYGLGLEDISDRKTIDEILNHIHAILTRLKQSNHWNSIGVDRNPNLFISCCMVFFLIEQAMAKKFSFHQELSEPLKSCHSSINFFTKDYEYFTYELAVGLKNPEYYLEKLSHTMTRIQKEKDVTYSWKYTMTHLIFYASNMGKYPLDWVSRQPLIKETLLFALEDSLSKEELDLSAELTIAMSYIGINNTKAQNNCLSKLKENISLDKSLPLKQGNKYTNKSGFLKYYHLLLTSLLALHQKNKQKS